MSLVRLNLDFEDPYFFKVFLAFYILLLTCKHVNYLGVGVCEYIYIFSRNIFKSHTILFFFSVNIYLELIY